RRARRGAAGARDVERLVGLRAVADPVGRVLRGPVLDPAALAGNEDHRVPRPALAPELDEVARAGVLDLRDLDAEAARDERGDGAGAHLARAEPVAPQLHDARRLEVADPELDLLLRAPRFPGAHEDLEREPAAVAAALRVALRDLLAAVEDVARRP